MTEKLFVSDLDVRNKKVLIRVDFNVPLNDQQEITDDTRIASSVQTIRYVLNNGGSVILMSHLGRPKGERLPEYSLRPCQNCLSGLLGVPVQMAPDCIGPEVEQMVKELQPGEVLLLENLRYYPAEEKPEKDPEFVKKLAKLGDLYVNDAFGTAHRAHASTTLIAKEFPGKAASGYLMKDEIDFIGSAVNSPDRPFYAIIGGAKVSSKLGVIKSLLQKVDRLLIGGAMSYTFLKAQNVDIGDSLYEPDLLEEAREILGSADSRKLVLPVDHVIVREIDEDAEQKIVTSHEGIPSGWKGVDIGPKTLAYYKEVLSDAATVVWNGPMGVFEVEPFSKGTFEIAQILADTSAITIAGGGDSVAAIRQAGLSDQFTHLSTGGGACLEYLEFGQLPGIDALSEKSAAKF